MLHVAENQQRFSAYYLQWLAGSRTALFGADDVIAARRLFDEAGNLELAWQIGIERGDYATLDAALDSWWMICDTHGWLVTGMTQTAALIAALRGLPPDSGQQTYLGRALAFHGMLAFRAGDYRVAHDALDEATRVLRQAQASSALPPALIFGGIVAALMGEFERARTLIDEGVALAARFGLRWFTALGQFDQGFIAGQQGDFEHAYVQMQMGLSIWRELHNARFIAFALNFFSPIVLQSGRMDEAGACLTESLELATQLHDRWGIGTACGRLGLLELERGNLLAAERLLAESLAAFTDLGARWDIAWTLTGQGRVYAALGNMPTAEITLRQALRLALAAQALPQALEASIELAACWLHDPATRLRGLDLLTAARAHPRVTATAQKRADSLLASFPAPALPISDWKTLVNAIVQEHGAAIAQPVLCT